MRIFLTVVVAALCCCSVYAQEQSGLAGTVTDQSGALVPNVTVTAKNGQTGLRRSVSTNVSGEYALPNLPVGTYDVTVEAAGFKTAVASGIKLNVQQTARVDVQLELGPVSEQVQVTSAAPLLQTVSSQVGTLVDNQRIVELPLNGRNFTQLTLLVPGAVESTPGDYVYTYSLATRGTGVSFSVNGQSANYNQYLLDGVVIKEVQHEGPAFSPSIDAIQEFQVQSSNYDAEFASEAGGQINLVTKSGTNSFHGTAYEFLRNDALDARNFFATSNPELRQNQFGGTLGGPIVKDRTFFFGSYEGTRIRRGFTQTALVPDASERSGDFSSLLSQGINVIDPLNGQPFPNDQIPANRISSVASTVLNKYVPLPNFSGNPAYNYVSLDANAINVNQYIGRVDHRLTDKHLLFARYLIESVDNISPKLFPTDSFQQRSEGQNAAIGYTFTISPTKINEIKFAYNRHAENEVVGQAFKDNVVGDLGLRGLCENPACWGIPDFYVGPYTNFGEHGQGQTVSGPRGWRNEIFEGGESFFWTHGSHSIKLGMQISRNRDTFPEAIYPRGEFSFDGRFTSPDGQPNSDTAMADFLLALPRSSEASIDIFNPKFRNNVLYPWIQDDWRVTPSFTLNLSLSYWWFGRPLSANQTIANIAFSGNTATLVTAADHAQANLPESLVRNDNNNFAPRIGFAWSPQRLRKLAIRGAYGVYYQRATINQWIDLAINPPFVRQTNYILEPSAVPSFNIQTVLAGVQPFPLLTFAIDPNWRDAYIQEWNFTTQYQIASSLALQVAYVGNKGTKLPASYDVNEAVLGPGDIQSRRPYANFGEINYVDTSGASTYNSLQVQLEKRLQSGLTFLTAYTFSKCMDNLGFQNILDRNEHGLCGLDTRQRFVTSATYELPIGKGRQFANKIKPLLNQIIGGWDINGILTLSAGKPFTIYAPGDWANVDGSAYAQVVGNPNLSGGQQSVNEYFNTAAFALPPVGQFGNAGRNIVIGPGIANLDLALMKNFLITETKTIEFRAESFNLLNHPSFYNPGNVVASPGFGVITGARDPRILQFALKLRF
jgi:hypothetical protein